MANGWPARIRRYRSRARAVLRPNGTARGRRPLPRTMTTWSSRSRSPGSMIPAASATRTPVSRNSRRIAASCRSVKSRPSQDFAQPAQLVVGQHRRWLIRDVRRVHAGHRTGGQLALGHRPLEERPETPVAVQRREQLPALQLVGDEGLHVVSGDRLDRQRVAAPAQEAGEQPDRLGVALDRALALVLRAERPAEAAVQRGKVQRSMPEPQRQVIR